MKKYILLILCLVPLLCMGQNKINNDTIEILELEPRFIKSIEELRAEAKIQADSVYRFLQNIDLKLFTHDRMIAIQESPLDLEMMKADGLDLLLDKEALYQTVSKENIQEMTECFDKNNDKYYRPIYNWHIGCIKDCVFGIADNAKFNERFIDIDKNVAGYKEHKEKHYTKKKIKKMFPPAYYTGVRKGFEEIRDNIVFIAMGVPAFDKSFQHVILPIYTNMTAQLRFYIYKRNTAEKWYQIGYFTKENNLILFRK
ncbi:MAG: hypothetical protein ACK5M3_06805 [Dysgonomonas sp.]